LQIDAMKSALAPPSLQKRENGLRFLPRDPVRRWPDDRKFAAAIFGADLCPLFCMNGSAASSCELLAESRTSLL